MSEINQEERNLDLLAIFHFLLAGLTLFFATLLIILIAFGAAIFLGHIELFLEPVPAIPEFIGWLVLIILCLLVILGWTLGILMIFTGLNLRKRSAYNFCFVVSALECLLVPYGTILGALTIVVLLKDSVKELFNAG